jgi:SAM-dependent methyltransferase
MMTAKDPIAKNLAFWNATSAAYQQTHGEQLAREPLAWGVWRIPEAELDILGDVAGRDVLELGCGGAQWASELAARGARVRGLDFSRAQLRAAAARADSLDVALPLVRANAECLPFAAASFDLVFCDHGAMTFARPERSVPEVARVLRPGGRFAFCNSSPIRDLCWAAGLEGLSERLQRDYFDMSALEDDEEVDFQLPYGAWIRLFRRCGLEVEDLVELRPPAHATTSYSDFAPLAWARRWPAENIWKLRKRAA